jgi:hypothetical protein
MIFQKSEPTEAATEVFVHASTGKAKNLVTSAPHDKRKKYTRQAGSISSTSGHVPYGAI